MRQNIAVVLIATVSAVDVTKSRHNSAYDEPYVADYHAPVVDAHDYGLVNYAHHGHGHGGHSHTSVTVNNEPRPNGDFPSSFLSDFDYSKGIHHGTVPTFGFDADDYDMYDFGDFSAMFDLDLPDLTVDTGDVEVVEAAYDPYDFYRGSTVGQIGLHHGIVYDEFNDPAHRLPEPEGGFKLDNGDDDDDDESVSESVSESASADDGDDGDDDDNKFVTPSGYDYSQFPMMGDDFKDHPHHVVTEGGEHHHYANPEECHDPCADVISENEHLKEELEDLKHELHELEAKLAHLQHHGHGHDDSHHDSHSSESESESSSESESESDDDDHHKDISNEEALAALDAVLSHTFHQVERNPHDSYDHSFHHHGNGAGHSH